MPNRKAWTPDFTRAEEQAIDRLVKESKLTRDFVVWWLATSGNTAMDFFARFGEKAGQQLQGMRQNEFIDKGYNAWQLERATSQEPTAGELAEAEAHGITLTDTDPTENPFGYLIEKLSEQTRIEAQAMGMDVTTYLQYLRAGGERPEGGLRLKADGTWETLAEGDLGADAGAVGGAIGDVFSPLTQAQLDELGAGQISEKFGLQRLAIEEPEAFLQAMFDKAGISPSPPVYGFLREMVPSLVTLASTREGQDLMEGPDAAIALNRTINEVISQGFPSRESVLAGLEGMGGQARPFLTGGYEDPRSRFSFVMGTLDRLIGPTLSEPLRRSLFSSQAAAQQGDRFLSAAGRGVFQGDFIDFLREQGYPIPDLPAYQAEPGAKLMEASEGGLVTGVSPTGAPSFVVEEGIYEVG